MVLMSGAAACPLAAHAQQETKLRRIVILSPGRSELPDSTFNMLTAFSQRLHELGYTEGQNIVLERHYAEWSLDRLREVTNGVIERQVDVLVAASTTAALAAKQATATIPIVAIAMADPVADDLVASLARPGGNVTGTTFLGPELTAKRLQLLREVVPTLSRVAALWHPKAYGERTMASILDEVEIAARGRWVYAFNSCRCSTPKTLRVHSRRSPETAPKPCFCFPARCCSANTDAS
jgi:ABC-type uncharacterized transport system substrate-binding protein